MTTPDSGESTASASDRTTEKPTVAELQADIEQTRGQLADTVDALSAKLDVKSRSRARLQQSKQQAVARIDAGRSRASELAVQARASATDEEGKPTPAVLAGAAVALSALVLVTVVLWRRR